MTFANGPFTDIIGYRRKMVCIFFSGRYKPSVNRGIKLDNFREVPATKNGLENRIFARKILANSNDFKIVGGFEMPSRDSRRPVSKPMKIAKNQKENPGPIANTHSFAAYKPRT